MNAPQTDGRMNLSRPARSQTLSELKQSLGKNARCAVPLPMPVSWQIVLQEHPWARKAAILAASTAVLGLPSHILASGVIW